MLIAHALAALLTACAPRVGRTTMAALVERESAGRPYAIGDGTAHRAYYPQTPAAAEQLVEALIERGHDLDLGYAQINLKTLGAYGVSPRAALEPCLNLALGAAVLRADYAREAARRGPGPAALAAALGAYHAGDARRGRPYAEDVFALGATLRFSAAP